MAQARRSISVLVVDDDPAVLRSVSRALSAKGMTVHGADSPLGVTALVRKYAPDAIVLDLNMPAMSGQRLATLISDATKGAPLPVVFYSGAPTDELYAATRVVPGSTYVSKDEGTGALVAAIHRSLKLDTKRSGLFKLDPDD